MKKQIIRIITALTLLIFASCSTSGNKRSTKIADYPKPTENISLHQGTAVCDTLERNIHTYKVISGDKYVISFKRTGVTINDAEDWDTKFEETLVFEIDTTAGKFEYCNLDLKEINCKYFWICYSKEVKKEIVKIEKGCISGQISKDSLDVSIDIDTDFGFGSLLEKKNKRKVKIDKTFNLKK